MSRNPKETRNYLGRRAAMLLGVKAAVVGGLALRMHQLQIEQADQYRLLAEENRINIRLLPPARGLIHDRNGKLLAGNRPNYKVIMVREQTGSPEAVLNSLAQLIRLPPGRIDEVLQDIGRRKGFVPVTVTEHLTWDEIARVAANAPALPGIIPEVGLSRYYPDGHPFAHVVGYVGPVSERDLEGIEDPDPLLQIPDFQIGKSGVELRMEPVLRGGAGTSRIEVNAAGRVMRELDRTEGKPGRDLHLTIDKDLQAFALRRMGGDSAAAVTLDIQTGDILTLASAPAFDPNSFVFGISVPEWNTLLNNDHRPMSNKPVSGAYPPGSTFKMVVALAAQEAGVMGPGETVWCPGHMQLGNRRFHCWKRGGHGHVNLKESLQQSCDVYYYEAARRTGIDRIADMARRLGFGQKHDLPVPAESEGLMPTSDWKKRSKDEDWLVGDSLNAGIGQGFVLATPLQLALMAARIASGRAVVPRLIRAIDGIAEPVPEAPPLAVPEAALTYVREGMFAVSNDRRGTAYRSRIDDEANRMAGKTGTSQVRIITADERARGVTRNEDLPWNRRDHALFVCFAPYDNPRFACAVVVEHGGGGSLAAAPIARDIVMRALWGGEPPLEAYPADQRETIRQQREAAPEPVVPDPAAPGTAAPGEAAPGAAAPDARDASPAVDPADQPAGGARDRA
jgi:penicillin-binding protein 2